MRTQEQLEAIAELSGREIAQLRKFEVLPEGTIGLDGIDKCSCYVNGRDTCLDLGITEDSGFTSTEISMAEVRFTIATARIFELI